MRLHILLVLMASSLAWNSCTSSGAFLASNRTNVDLSQANYVIAAPNINGEAESAYVLGVSYSNGLIANTLAIGRVEGTGMLYKEAFEDLWQNFETSYGKSEGRKLALANVRYDTDILNLLFYTKVKIAIRADVIEFKQ